MKPRGYVPAQLDLDFIESLSAPPGAALLAIEAAAEPLGVPIVDRASGRLLSILASGRRRIVEVGTAYGYSTLWLALGQPADGHIVTIDPDTERTALARGWWRQAGIADDRITVVSRPALAAFADARPGPRRPLRPRLHRRAQGRVRRLPGRAALAPGPRRARRRRQRPVGRGNGTTGRSGRSLPGHPGAARLRRRRAGRPELLGDHPAGRRRAARGGTPLSASPGPMPDASEPGTPAPRPAPCRASGGMPTS